MANRFINKMSDEEGTLCADVDNAKGKLEGFLETCKSRGHTIEEHAVIGEEFPSYLSNDNGGTLVGDFTITSD